MADCTKCEVSDCLLFQNNQKFRTLVLNKAGYPMLKYADVDHAPRDVLVCETCFQKQTFKLRCWICKRFMANFGFYLDSDSNACSYCLPLPKLYKTIIDANVKPRPASYQDLKLGILEADLELQVEIMGKYMIYHSLKSPYLKQEYSNKFLRLSQLNESQWQWDYFEKSHNFVKTYFKNFFESKGKRIR
uniref:Uncharacterized protein n=1 Tax=Marseillevirus LCMAC101 TaxID=2506602 RepID=A0A481YR74_9VIRU|nr:MAG: hypothetical protein LCMAC101_03060 [Marseillevirus LCMAC101]